MAEYKKTIIGVVGPTASGKTALGVALAKRFNGEVVSCDSMQIYGDMTVATAAPTPEEMQGIPHHLVGIASPQEEFNVVRYCALAKQCIEDILSRGKIPVIVGGTGLYFHSLADNITFQQEENDGTYRALLQKRAETEGAQVLLDELFALDPETAKTLHIHNLGRIIRALEVYHLTGRTMSETRRLSKAEASDYDPVIIGLDAENRQFLYDRIDRRVDLMLEKGLVEEARHFYNTYQGKTAVQAIGYKELKPYLDGEESLRECVTRLKFATHHYAKRQLTWFRRDGRIHFLKIDRYDGFDSLCEDAAVWLEEQMRERRESE